MFCDKAEVNFNNRSYRGWILASEKHAKILQRIGVELGEQDGMIYNNCIVSASALHRMKPLWGQITWELEPH